jgi:poly(3-hydroxybutyrate) depolymerase
VSAARVSGSSAGGSGGAGMAGTPATGGSPATAGSGGVGGGAAGAAGGTAVDVTKVWKSDGCGQTAPAAGRNEIPTMGTKAADCAAKLGGEAKCGPWGQDASTWLKQPLPRYHWIYLPDNYDPNKAYPIVLEGHGCNPDYMAEPDVYDYANNANNTVIRVAVRSANPIIGHGTNEGQGCYDDKEGDDSVDFVHYEALYDDLNKKVCFDRNRVFIGGNSSGAWWANEIGCHYAGDPTRPMRGIFPNTGGLPSEPQWKPTCTDKPMTGIWTHSTGDMTNPFAGNKYAIARAMKVNGCTIGDSFDNTMLEDYPVPGRPAGECKKIKGCPELYPLIVCPLNLGNEHGSHDQTVDNTVSFFLQAIQKPPFLTP